MQRTIDIRIRLTPEERAVIDRAVEPSGLTLSAWVRVVLLREARRERNEVELRVIGRPG